MQYVHVLMHLSFILVFSFDAITLFSDNMQEGDNSFHRDHLTYYYHHFASTSMFIIIPLLLKGH